jgi:hypothetical protein
MARNVDMSVFIPKGKMQPVKPDFPPEIMLTGDPDIDKMIEDCLHTLKTKGAEYTVNSVDRLANFRGVAEDTGVPMEKAWAIFWNKHVRAIMAYVKNGCKVQSDEPIRGRVMDCIVYLLLFTKMIAEIEGKRDGK